ncbi:kinase-like domain-containing protein [Pilobolus umbonatus]|nr:kinase-like domain-containing protein [Pilobolus umbonatus]
MTTPYHIRQSSNPRQNILGRSVDANYLKPLTSDNNNSKYYTTGVECASFDSNRTDLSINSRDVIIAEQWVVLGRIGEGSFGEVFEAEDIVTNRRYAIKRESLKMHHPQIKHESIIYDVLAGGPGIPQCHWHGQHDGFDCIVIDLLGPNLNQLREVTRPFPIEVVIEMGCQILNILEHIHKKGLVYRDVKPDNFLFPANCQLPEPEMVEVPDDHGMPHIKYVNPTCEEVFRRWNNPCPKLYVVDFGLTTWWRNPNTDKPYPETKRNMKNKTGTARYASLNVHRGKPHSRRDDIESLGYLLLDLIFGTLPWTGIQARNSRAGWDRMKQIKEDTFMDELCAGLPRGFLSFIEYSRSLKFLDEPNYDLLRQFLQGSLNGGEYSTITKSPFGGHTERKWVMEIEKECNATRDHQPRPYTNPEHHSNAHSTPHHTPDVNHNNNSHYHSSYNPNQHTHNNHINNNNNNHGINSNNTNNNSRQRRASYTAPNSRRYSNHHHTNEDTGVFDMDELISTLPQVVEQYVFSKQYQGGYRSKMNHQYDKSNPPQHVNRRLSRDYGNIPREINNTSPSSFQKIVMKTRRNQKKVGWNSHKHDEAPWIPVTDWEPQNKPDTSITYASWGDNHADGVWRDKNTVTESKEDDSWASKVNKPWE